MPKFFRVILTLTIFLHIELFALQLSTKIITSTSKKAYWSKLLHYENGNSIIDTDSFFLSSNGKNSLESELIATLEAFENNESTICKYPARYKWLNYLGLVEKTEIECKNLNEFTAANFTKISIAFSTERYNAAASLFGHVFLKLDSQSTSNVIEYTAKIPQDTSPLSYVYEGLFGGFTSKYNFFSFNVKDFEARDEEFRDLVLYELDFKAEQIENIMLHLFEIKDTTQKYYFLWRNCSSELIKLLDISKYDNDISNSFGIFTLPVEVVKSADDNKYINNIKILHSKLSQYNSNYELLNTEEKILLKEIVFNKRSITSFLKDKEINKVSKDKVVLAGILFFEIKIQGDEFSRKDISKLFNLSEYINMNSLSKNYEKIIIKENPISPAIYMFGVGYMKKKDSFAIINARYLYKNRFDLLDNMQKNGTVEFLSFTLRLNKKMSLEKFTLLHLASMPISSEFFSELTKEINIGAKRLFYNDKLYAFGEYGMGKKLRISSKTSFSFSALGGIYNSDDKLVSIGLNADLEYKEVSKNLLRIGIEMKMYEGDKFISSRETHKVYANTNFRISKEILLSAKVDYNIDVEKYFTSMLYCNYSF